MIIILLKFYLFIYLFISFKIVKFIFLKTTNIFECNIIHNVSKIFVFFIFLSHLMIFLIHYSFIYFILFYVFYSELFIIILRIEVLKFFFFFLNFFKLEFFYKKKRNLKKLDYRVFLYKNLRKSYIIFIPIFMYFYDSHIFNLINFLILINFKFFDFKYVFDKALYNYFDDDEIILTKKGLLKIREYQIYLIDNILRLNFRSMFDKRLVKGVDYNYKFNILNLIK